MAVKVVQIQAQELAGLLQRLQAQQLETGDYPLLQQLLESYRHLWQLLEQKNMTLGRLHRMLFGPRTEKDPPKSGPETGRCESSKPKTKPKGHGRNGASQYPGARQVGVAHPHLQAGAACPACGQGKVYRQQQPSVIVHIVGRPLFEGTVYHLEKWRCNACGQVFTAPPPPVAGQSKYDPSVGCMLAVLRYGSGMPFYRIEQLQKSFGVPLPAATQWEQIQEVVKPALVVHQHLVAVAAQGQLLHNDDTSMTVQSLRAGPPSPQGKTNPKERTGVFTSGIVSRVGDHQVALYFTGRRHAGENLNEVLKLRQQQLPPPLQMCDGLSRNEPKEWKTVLLNCLAHGRRQFIDIQENFPQECAQVLESLRQVYHHDTQAKQEGLSPAQRLAFHQEHSQPVMDQLKDWMTQQLEHKKIEPNSGLGKACNYLLKRWEALTQFLRLPGAPLDNNLCERALKRAVLHRKNSLLYKTQWGAKVGDVFMSLIETCRLCAANPFAYLMSLQTAHQRVERDPQDWLPWNYRQAAHAEDTS